MLVAKPANFFDLILAQQASLQPCTPVVALEHVILRQSSKNQETRLGGQPLAIDDLRRMRPVEKVGEALPAIQLGLEGLDLGSEAFQSLAVAADFPTDFGQLL